MTVNFNVSPDDLDVILEIADRALVASAAMGFRLDPLTVTMDIAACHKNGNPLDLAGLLAADDSTFAHDVFGIVRHINRETGVLGDCFVPRMSLREEA